MYPTYPLMKYVSFLMNEVDNTAPKEPTIDMLPKTIWEKYSVKTFALYFS